MCWQIEALMRAQVIADIFPAAFITSVHFVAALCAPGDAVQQKIAVTGRSSRFEAHVFSSIVLDNAADFFIAGPVDVGWIPVPHDDPPLLEGKGHFPGRAALTDDVAGTSPPVDETPGIGGFWQDPRHRRYRCSRPTQVAVTVAAREIKAALVQDAHDLGDGAEFQEALEHKPKPLLYLGV